MQKSKAPKYIGSTCFFVASLILSACAFYSDEFTSGSNSSFLKTAMRIIDKYIVKYGGTYSICGWTAGYLFATVIIFSFLFVIIGFLKEEKRYITIGAIIGIVAQCLNCIGLLFSIESMLHDGHWFYSVMLTTYALRGPSIPFELLLFLFFVVLLLCSLDLKHSRIYGIIGAVLILARPVPAGYLGGYYWFNKMLDFRLSPWAIATSVLFALGSLMLGFYFAPFSVKKANKHNASMKGATKIDKIVRLKGLLDMGAITQEEFDAKKKEIIEK